MQRCKTKQKIWVASEFFFKFDFEWLTPRWKHGKVYRKSCRKNMKVKKKGSFSWKHKKIDSIST